MNIKMCFLLSLIVSTSAFSMQQEEPQDTISRMASLTLFNPDKHPMQIELNVHTLNTNQMPWYKRFFYKAWGSWPTFSEEPSNELGHALSNKQYLQLCQFFGATTSTLHRPKIVAALSALGAGLGTFLYYKLKHNTRSIGRSLLHAFGSSAIGYALTATHIVDKSKRLTAQAYAHLYSGGLGLTPQQQYRVYYQDLEPLIKPMNMWINNLMQRRERKTRQQG